MSDPLSGKTLYAFGTSIVEGHAAHRSFVDDIGDAHQLHCQKFSINGASMRIIAAADPAIDIVQQAVNAPAEVPDFVVFDGIANDAYANITEKPKVLGMITPDFTTPLEPYTYCGAFETVCRLLLTKYQGAHPLYIATHKTPARTLAAQDRLHALSVAMCQKWSISVVDLYAQSGFNAFLPTYQHDYSYDKLDANGSNRQAVGGTGPHPNAAGYRLFYDPLITAALLRLAN
ncbi:SGNH/GDSL hydrolase family protein [Schleiferilactobacillus harbinensis]|uniref:SGNH/GDSL hydrolase family protein n=1 Tax=Schleiferilactobacillus harbinensis TaxID=304207 RepID=UPI001239E7E2|nr:SGNH/GDSL hydrolase family protein [Schleiferilactobacillus harbinensis]QEU47371.1 SGNH/GDSL hydrolase family protein [Schleiferilactobacillus harbinensis]